MKPRNDGEAIVDVLDVILRDGAMVQADVMIGLADVPLIGINLRAAIAGMQTMTEYGLFEEWDDTVRSRSTPVTDQQGRSGGSEAEEGRADAQNP